MEPVIIVHGGCSNALLYVKDATDILDPLTVAAEEGYKTLMQPSKTALDAVETAVTVMEDNPVFNAGIGSKLRIDGSIQMDAIIMEGQFLKAGSVGCIENVQNPIKVARSVMEKTNHVALVGDGATSFARSQGFPECPKEKLITPRAIKQLQKFHEDSAGQTDGAKTMGDCDTVGAVAIDINGNIAFASSTGGLTGCMRGRVGDSGQIGSGGYCDNNIGGAATTGIGEVMIRMNLARLILFNMQQGSSVDDALKKALSEVCSRTGCDEIGAIAINRTGDIGYHFFGTMSWAYIKMDELHYGMKKGEHFVRTISS